jgi:PAS domain-containing protein
VVLGISVAEFLAAGLMFGMLYDRRRVLSLLWYGLGLGLIAVGLFLVALGLPGTMIGWLGRASQYLGAAYLLVAIALDDRSTEGVGISIELAYRESEERYHALAELLPDAVLVHVEGSCLFANRACLKLFGVSLPGGLVGRELPSWSTPTTAPLCGPAWRQKRPRRERPPAPSSGLTGPTGSGRLSR